MFTRSVLCVAVLWFAVQAPAAGFDCAQASTAHEKAVCADSKLSKLDEDLNAAYKAQRAQLSASGAAGVQQDERAWLTWLQQVCGERQNQRRPVAECVKSKYSERLYMLRRGVERAGGMIFFPRLKVMVAADEEPAIPNTSDPGFGVGAFSWPEIDRPTPRQAAWNAAMRKQAAAAAANPDSAQARPADFEPGSVAGADVSVTYRLQAVNDRLISVTLENETYNYGAAHPNEFAIAFHWWLEAGRALTADDVFAPGGGWESFVAERCYQKLTTGEHKDDLYEEQNVRRAVADSIKAVSNWIVDAQKLEIDFPEYTVAPRVAGFVSVELSWDELKPYLAGGFDPAGLPQPLAAQ